MAAPEYPVRIDLRAARRATEARDRVKAQKTKVAKAILDPDQALARAYRVQGEESLSDGKVIKRSGTGYGGYRGK